MAHCMGCCLRGRKQQLISLNAERDRDALDVVQRDVSGLPLHMRDKGSVKPTFKGQRLLRPPFGAAQLHHVGGQQSSCAAGFGRRMVGL